MTRSVPRQSPRRNQSSRAAIVGLGVLLLASACGAPGSEEKTARGDGGLGRVRIVASIAPLADLARRVGGDRCEVATLVPPGASAHTWEPSPRDAERLSRCDLFFQVGLGYESWLSKLVGAGGPGFVTVDGSEGVDLLYAHETSKRAPGSRSNQAGGRGQGGSGLPNPHYWLDPIAMKGAVTRLAEVLASKDPGGAAGYRARAAQTNADLDALDAELRQRTSRFTAREIVTFHAAWDYLARRYGLTVIAAIEEFPGKEPGPRYIAEIVRLVREKSLRAIFAEPQFPAKSAEAIAAECGVRVLTLDPVGGEGVPQRGDYFSLLRYNLSVMEEALR